jgi:hypothetical protein
MAAEYISGEFGQFFDLVKRIHDIFIYSYPKPCLTPGMPFVIVYR